MRARQFEERIARLLEKAGLEFERSPAIGGLRPDFLVNGPNGELVVIEAKAWHPRGGNTARALEQAESYRSATQADRAFVVMPDVKRNFEAKGVVSVTTLLSSLQRYFDEPSSGRRKSKSGRQSSDRIIFAAMPFDREYDDTYFVAMSHAAEKVNASCKRVDGEEFSGDIVAEIKRLPNQSVAVIVDLYEAKPNVLYEAGIRRGIA